MKSTILDKKYEYYDAISFATNRMRDRIYRLHPRDIDQAIFLERFNMAFTSTVNLYTSYVFMCNTENELSILVAIVYQRLAEIELTLFDLIKFMKK